MTTRNCLILSQYREGSDYQDKIGRTYHFPRRYYSLLTLSDAQFVYYEPRQSGKGEYFGYGRVGSIAQDPSQKDLYFAELLDYRPFSEPVPYKDEEGIHVEESLPKLAQLAVRKVDEDVFEDLCRKGGLDLSTFGVESENVESDERIRDPFDPATIKIDRETQPIFQVVRKIDFKEIILNPDFQRNLVWDVVRRSRLIESVLLKIPLPAFYFDATKDNNWLVVDGLQRLTSLKEFILEKSLRLQDLEYLTNLEGKAYDEIPRNLQRQIEETPLTLYVIRPDTPPDVKFTIFYRINTGGLVLTAQEIRNALFIGPATRVLKHLSLTAEFRAATEGSLSDTRMDAQECILRYLAFRIRGYRNYQKADLNLFLSEAMKEINEMRQERLESLERDFMEGMNRARVILGRYAFRKFNTSTQRRGPINKALFESWPNILQEFEEFRLVDRREALLAGLEEELRFNSDYSRYLSAGTGSVKAVIGRFRIAHEIVTKALG
jgi:hypothetical protein